MILPSRPGPRLNLGVVVAIMRVGQQRTEQQATVHNLVVEIIICREARGLSRGGLEDAREGGFVCCSCFLFVCCLFSGAHTAQNPLKPQIKRPIKTLVLHQHQRPESVYKKSESSPVFV